MSIEISQLDNGLKVVSEYRQSLETASVGVWSNVGARYEDASINGISHCLEHMVFKGTETRSARDIAVALEGVGGHLNAYTTRDHTCYYARVLKDDSALAVDVLSDLVLNPALDPRELEREKDVILQEIGQSEDTPDDIIYDHLQDACYRDQALGRSILGSDETVKALTVGDLQTYLSRFYCPNNLVVSATGNLEHARLVDLVAERFESRKKGDPKPPQDARFTGGDHRDERDQEQVHVALAMEGYAYGDTDFYAAQVYNMLLGGGMSSRLFQEVREEQGLAYSIYSFAASHADTGTFGVYGGTAPDRAQQLLDAVAGEIRRVAKDLREDEVKMARTQLTAGLMMALESTTSRMEQLGRQTLLFGVPVDTPELMRRVNAVDYDQVMGVAQRFADGPTSALALIGDAPLGHLTF